MFVSIQPKDDGVDGLSWNLEELQEASDDQSSELSDLWSAEGGYEADSERDEREDALTSKIAFLSSFFPDHNYK